MLAIYQAPFLCAADFRCYGLATELCVGSQVRQQIMGGAKEFGRIALPPCCLVVIFRSHSLINVFIPRAFESLPRSSVSLRLKYTPVLRRAPHLAIAPA